MLERRPLLILLLGFQVLLAPAAASAASAETDRESRVPSVSFLEEGTMIVEAEQVERQEGLVVALHNDLPRAQTVAARVVGLAKNKGKGTRTFLSSKEVFSRNEVQPGHSVSILIPLRKRAKTPEASIEAVLVASGREGGGLVRRPLTITPPEAEEETKTPTEEQEENALRPERALNLTLVAVNLLPSPLASAGSLGLAILLLAAFFLAFLHKQMKRLWKNAYKVPLAVGLAGALLGGVAMLSGIWEQPPWHAISPRAVEVATVDEGNVGTVASEDGTIAQLVVAEQELLPVGLDSAGTYKGKYDLTPNAEKGDAEATVNVRDFWPYAVATIFLGLLIAYLFHQWFNASRPRDRLTLRRKDLEADYRRWRKKYEEETSGLPVPAVPSLDTHFKRLAAAIELDLEEGSAKAGTEKAEKMRSYLDQCYLLLRAMTKLGRGAKNLKELHASRSFGFELAEVEPYQAAVRALGDAADSVVPEDDGETLKTTRAEIEKQAAAMREAADLYQSILQELAVVARLEPVAGSHETELEAVRKELVGMAGEILRSKIDDEGKGLEEIEKKEDTAAGTLLRIRNEIAEEGKEQVLGPPASHLGLTTAAMRRISSMGTKLSGVDLELVEEAKRPRAEIRWRGTDARDFDYREVYREDEVDFKIVVRDAGSLGDGRLVLDFGDGASKTFELGSGDEQSFSVKHEYGEGGREFEVTCTGPEGLELGAEWIAVSPESQIERGRAELQGRDRVVAGAALVLAVASGMATLYYADASWGEPADYLAALVWGGLANEAVKGATAILDKVLPSG